MIGSDEVRALRGATAVDPDGHKIGTVGEPYVTDDGPPRWVSIHTGLFGRRETLVPLDQATLDGGALRLPYSKATVKDAPHIDPDTDLSPEQESELHSYYEVTASSGSMRRAAAEGPDEDLPADRNIVATSDLPPEHPHFIAEGVMLHPDEDDQIRRGQIDFDGEVGRDRV